MTGTWSRVFKPNVPYSPGHPNPGASSLQAYKNQAELALRYRPPSESTVLTRWHGPLRRFAVLHVSQVCDSFIHHVFVGGYLEATDIISGPAT